MKGKPVMPEPSPTWDLVLAWLKECVGPSAVVSPDDRDALVARIDAFAAAHMKAWRHERRQMSPDGPHCDLCQERVQEDGSDWRWVDEGWSLACLSCLEKIAAARVAAERELCAMIVHKWFAAQFKEYERAHHADEGAVEAMYDHATNVLDDIIVEIRQRADAAQSAPPEARDA